ncbi:MAG: long-chain fatty acid--CoA ligase [Clostridia bacterium]|nr:long-chain fatty acid--CoA ligase [Clostridia bacterium]
MENQEKIENFRQLIEIAKRGNPEHIVYKFKKDITAKTPQYIEIKYQDFKKEIEAMSTALLNLGLENKKIALVGNNRYEWCVSYLATTTGNMVIVPLDRALPDNELEKLIKRSGATAVICENKHQELVQKIKKQKDNVLETIINMDLEKTEEKEVKSFWEVLQQGKQQLEKGDTKYQQIEIDCNKMAIMLFTSGTTSEPKAVMLSQNNICSNVTSLSHYLKLYATDTLLSFLPIHHTFECTITFLFGLYWGATVAFCDGLKYIQQNLIEYEISVFVSVPVVLETMYKKIQKAMEQKIPVEKILGSHLRTILYGAASMNKDTTMGYNELGITSTQGYGLTETSPVISAEADDRKKPGSVGLVLDNLEVKIEEPNQEGIGEIVVKGPSIMLGYYNNEEETKKVLQDGWFKTGDYGYLDKDGFLFVTGRKKDIIVLKNGKNVYPQEIEFLLNKIPYVLESLVYQREQSQTDTMLCAKIVYDENLIKEALGERTEEEYQKIIWEETKKINQTLPIYKHIKKIAITTIPFAKTTTQKVKRFEVLKTV